jgi:hypothetical protein
MSRWPLLLLATLLLACSSIFAPAKQYWPDLPDGHFMHVGEFIQVSGTGSAGPSTSDTERKSVSRDAALLDAWERLRAYISVLVLPDGMRVNDRMAASEEYAAGIHRLVQRGKLVSTQYTADDTAIVILRISKSEINNALGTRFQ